MKKRAFALAAALCLSLSAPAAAANQPGDTTVTDAKGNVYTLSNPILYTVPVSELNSVIPGESPSTNLDDVKKNVSVLYAVPADTLITCPTQSYFDYIWGLFIEPDGQSLRAGSEIGPGPQFSSFQLEPGYEGAVFYFPCYAGNIDEVEYQSDIQNFIGNIGFFVPFDDSGKSPFASAKPAFADVASNAYYADSVSWAVEKSITSGTSATTFSPDETCTRAQIIAFLWRAAGSPEPKGSAAFPDVAASAYYARAAAWAAENGIADGSTFSPDAPCTREMAVEFMWKYAGSPDAAPANFSDASSAAVSWAVETGVTSGTSDTTFSPEETCTRAQIASFLYRAFAK